MITKKPINRKMKLTPVLDTVNGEPIIGCRASGVYKGFHIERVAKVPVKNLEVLPPDRLERLAVSRYEHECRIIDGVDEPDIID